jgi:hypothetical protein
MNKITFLSAIGALSVILSSFGAAPAVATPSLCDSIAGNLVQNCGFELPSAPGLITDWTLVGNPALTAVKMGGTAHTGTSGLNEGQNGSEGTLTQTLLATTAGTTYEITVWFQSIQNRAGQPSDFNVTFGGHEGIDLINPGVVAYTVPYTAFSFDAVAAGAGTPLVLGFRNDSSFDQIDDISVVPAPEPSTLLLLGAGLLGFGLVRRRKAA